MKNTTRTPGKIGIALMLTIGLGIAGCGQQTAPAEIALDAVQSSASASTEGGLSAKAGTPIGAGNWSTVFSTVKGSTATEPTPPIAMDANGKLAGYPQLNHTLNGDIITRSGTFVDGVGKTWYMTAYLQRVAPGSQAFAGWYSKMDVAGSSGYVGYFEMERTTPGSTLAGNWKFAVSYEIERGLYFATVPMNPSSGATRFPTSQPKLAYKCINNPGEPRKIQRLGTFGAVSGSGELIETQPGQNLYLGWYLNSEDNQFGLLSLQNDCQTANSWNLRVNQLPMESVTRSTFAINAAGQQVGAESLYYTKSGSEIHRNGTFGNGKNAAQLLATTPRGNSYAGWFAANKKLGVLSIAQHKLKYQGFSLSGMEASEGTGVGSESINYFFPTKYNYSGDKLLDRGLNTIRLPIRWERLMPVKGKTADGCLDLRNYITTDPNDNASAAAYFNEIKAIVDRTTARGANLILDLHNYGEYITPGGKYRLDTQCGPAVDKDGTYTGGIRADQLSTTWSALTQKFAGNSRVIMGLMNEPRSSNLQPEPQVQRVYAAWASAAQASIRAIRQTEAQSQGVSHLILVSGNYYSGAHSWLGGGGAGGNAQLMRNVDLNPATNAPFPNIAFEVHQYFDTNFTGSAKVDNCSSVRPAQLLQGFTNWLNTNGKKGFLGEFGVWDGQTNCAAYLKETLDHLENNSNVWLGWTYWSAGPTAKLNDKLVLERRINNSDDINTPREFVADTLNAIRP
jgi:endoglucanase